MYKSILCIMCSLLLIACQPQAVSYQPSGPLPAEERDRLWQKTCDNARYGCLKGQVRDQTGRPVLIEIYVYLVPSSPDPQQQTSLLSALDKDGMYRISRVPLGDATVLVPIPDPTVPDGMREILFPVTILPGQITHMDLILDTVVPAPTATP